LDGLHWPNRVAIVEAQRWPQLLASGGERAGRFHAPVRRHRRAQGGSPMLRSIRPTLATPD